MIQSIFACVACPHCGTCHTITRDEDGGAELDSVPCCDDDCTERLCSVCALPCFSCDLPGCREHMIEYGAERYCRVCWGHIQEDADAAHVEIVGEAMLVEEEPCVDTIWRWGGKVGAGVAKG